jgi:hypothetical protein
MLSYGKINAAAWSTISDSKGGFSDNHSVQEFQESVLMRGS